ncbi:MAG: sugar phosphate isomerase/epimerase [Synergistaceae bacterium]|jgi:myo-inositol catabolism protein IolH|nr:sugar phosphate isomerase/epimerase [Synergistaceae bacterium]
MKIACDVDVLAKEMSVSDYVRVVADWGFKYIEQSPHIRINPIYKHPLFSRDCEKEYKKALAETGLEISSFIGIYRWSGPTEEERRMAVANWRRLVEIAVNMGVGVINTELSGSPNDENMCNGMWYRSMDELLPLFEKENIRVEIQAHPFDFCEFNDETVDMVDSYRSDNVTYVYSSAHTFYYDNGIGDVRHMLEYAGDRLSHVLIADSFNHKLNYRYIQNPSWLNKRGKVDATVHQHLPMDEGDVDFEVLFETLRDTGFANRQLKIGGEPIICVSYFGFPERMDETAPKARERIERELLNR